MAEKKSSSAGGGGMGLCSVLFVVFLVLKLCGVITWSWWWVTAPLWGPVALLLIGVALFFLVIGVLSGIAALGTKS